MSSAKRFPCRPESVQAARRHVREALRGQARDVVSAAELMTSELATNSVLHAHTDFELAVVLDETIRIEVRDMGAGQPTPRSPGPLERTGRGLRIVEAMSHDWGISSAPGGKTVWFVLEAQPAHEHAGRPASASEGAGTATRAAGAEADPRTSTSGAPRTRGCRCCARPSRRRTRRRAVASGCPLRRDRGGRHGLPLGRPWRPYPSGGARK